MDPKQRLLEWYGYMTVAEACEFLECKPAHLRKLLCKGFVKGFRLAGEWRIAPTDLLIYIEEHSN